MTDSNKQTELLQFKTFVNQHPRLLREVRKHGRSWQEIYEQWVLLGEDDVYWNTFKDIETTEDQREKTFAKLDLKPELVKQVIKYAETIDIYKLQEQIQQVSKTISTVQEIVDQYKQSRSTNTERNRPFDWFSD